MKCECCGRNKKVFESFESVKYGSTIINICVSCSKILYKLRDANNDNNSEKKEQFIKELTEKSRNATPNFELWIGEFLKKLI